MEPLPETDEALDEFVGDLDRELRVELFEMGRRAVAIVPSCIGISLMLVREQLTFTLVATSVEAAGVDVAQYLDSGPCLASIESGSSVETEVDDLFDEGRWSLFARASAAQGVSSSLSMPIHHEESVVGSVNLYAGTMRAFEGHHDALARALGATAVGAVVDADLGFTTRLAARQAPARLADLRFVEVAIGRLAAWQSRGVAAATEALEDAAARAGISLVAAAQVVLGLPHALN